VVTRLRGMAGAGVQGCRAREADGCKLLGLDELKAFKITFAAKVLAMRVWQRLSERISRWCFGGGGVWESWRNIGGCWDSM